MRSLDKDVSIEEARKCARTQPLSTRSPSQRPKWVSRLRAPAGAIADLGRFGLSGDLALKPIGVLSGGQKSRLAFAELAFKQPHILLLDEPTNHLDSETIEGLALALNQFEGGVVLVSHDERLISLVADEIWAVHKGEGGRPGTVSVFDGSFDDYKARSAARRARR